MPTIIKSCLECLHEFTPRTMYVKYCEACEYIRHMSDKKDDKSSPRDRAITKSWDKVDEWSKESIKKGWKKASQTSHNKILQDYYDRMHL